jgi:hypothetical protein
MSKVIPPVIPVVGVTNSTSTATTAEPEGILFTVGEAPRGGPGAKGAKRTNTYKSKSSAEAAFKTGTLPKSQMDMINSAYAKYGKSMGFQKASSFAMSLSGCKGGTFPLHNLCINTKVLLMKFPKTATSSLFRASWNPFHVNSLSLVSGAIAVR